MKSLIVVLIVGLLTCVSCNKHGVVIEGDTADDTVLVDTDSVNLVSPDTIILDSII